MSLNSRRAFTLVELLVVIGIIAVLIGLILPAVQKVRSAAARVVCLNNMKQIGLAAQHYHGVKKSFPPGLRYQAGADPNYLMSWLASILPYIEQDNLYLATLDAYRKSPDPFKDPPHVGLATVVADFGCPADYRSGRADIAARSQYTVAFTWYLGVIGKDLYTQDGVLYRDSRIRIADITDGASNTLFAGERPPSWDNQYGWWYAGVGQKLTGSGDMVLGVEEPNILTVTVGSCAPGTYKFGPGDIGNQCDMFHFWSMHPGGANFLFADGSVHFLSYSAAPILPALASRAGGEPTPIWD